MRRRSKMCSTCPFRGADDAYKADSATIQPDDWPCHSEGHFGQGSDIQCRGHYEARRKFNVADTPQSGQGVGDGLQTGGVGL